MRRAPHDGQKLRRLQENATSFSCAQFPPKTARTLDCLFVLLDFIAVSC